MAAKKRKGYAAPRTVTVGLRAQAWWVLRKNKSITLAELRLTICKGTELTPEVNLRRWLNALLAVGLLTRKLEDDGKPASNGSYRYTLVKDIGPKAPVVRMKDRVVFNPNNGETLAMKTEDELIGTTETNRG
ncbi:hypothetical protein [Methylobacter sp.]|uniref:hypothetical protein n=1 Tax=Methylobacter sp. TaxID=2051955 RepID=UPI002FDEBBD5